VSVTYLEAIREAQARLLREDERVFIYGQDIGGKFGGAFKATKGLATEFPGRVLNTPISEDAMVGTAIGAAVGAVVGGLAGHGVAEMIDPTAEDAYWRANYEKQDYVAAGSTYDDYGPAYRYGVDSYGRYSDRSFDEVESDLGRNWDRARGNSSLAWDRAKYATRDSWQRVSDAVERATPGDSDHDGK